MCDEDFDYGDPGSMFDYDGDGELDHAERGLYYDYLDRSERDEWDDDDDDDDWDTDDDDDDYDATLSYFGDMDDDLAEDLHEEGVDPDDFDLMSDYEKYKTLRKTTLDEDDYKECFDDYDFYDDNWYLIKKLTDDGIDFENFRMLDDEDKYDLLMGHNMDPDYFCDLFDDDDYPSDRQEAEKEEDNEEDDEDRVRLDVTRIVKKEKRNVDLTDLIGKIYAKCDTFDSIKGWKKSGKLKLRDQFRVDLMKFCMFLSSSDGNVDDSESLFFKSQLGAALSADNIRDFIKSQKIDSAEYVKTPPQTIVELVNNKDVLESIGAKTKYAVQEFVNVYETVGYEIIACDGTIDEKEKTDLKNYICMICEYAGIGDTGARTTSSSIPLVDNVYDEAIYKVGVDIPPGIYKLFSKTKSGYFTVYEDANGTEIWENGNFERQAYIYIKEGFFFKLRECVAVPVDDAVMFEGDEYPPGEYYVGRELPPGEYRIETEPGKSGYYAVKRLMADGSRSLLSNNSFSNSAYVQLEDKQLLCMSDCSLKR